MLVILILIFIVPVAVILGLHFISNAVGKKMRVKLHKENEPAVYVESNLNDPVFNGDNALNPSFPCSNLNIFSE